jgi:hypothetical protein
MLGEEVVGRDALEAVGVISVDCQLALGAVTRIRVLGGV